MWKRQTTHKQEHRQKRTFFGASQTIGLFVLLILLIGCRSPSSSGQTPPPVPKSSPTASPTGTTPVYPTATPTTRPTPMPSPAPEPTPSPTPRPTTVASPCEATAGVQPVSAVEVDQGNTSRPRVAFTFDAGGPAEPASRILDILAQYNLHTTWFITGQWAQQNPDLVRRVWNAGHEIGNHTMHHPDLTTLADAQLCTELNQADQIILGITGYTTRPYFRPPYGARNEHVRQLVAHLGYRTIYWTIDTLDWKSDATAEKIIDRVMSQVSNGAIILMHAGSSAEADALETLISRLQERGYEIVNLTSVLQ